MIRSAPVAETVQPQRVALAARDRAELPVLHKTLTLLLEAEQGEAAAMSRKAVTVDQVANGIQPTGLVGAVAAV